MDFPDQIVRRNSDDGEGANPLARSWMTPILPKPSDGERRAVLHGDGVGLFRPRSFDGTPFKEAFNRNDAAALGIGGSAGERQIRLWRAFRGTTPNSSPRPYPSRIFDHKCRITRLDQDDTLSKQNRDC